MQISRFRGGRRAAVTIALAVLLLGLGGCYHYRGSYYGHGVHPGYGHGGYGYRGHGYRGGYWYRGPGRGYGKGYRYRGHGGYRGRY